MGVLAGEENVEQAAAGVRGFLGAKQEKQRLISKCFSCVTSWAHPVMMALRRVALSSSERIKMEEENSRGSEVERDETWRHNKQATLGAWLTCTIFK